MGLIVLLAAGSLAAAEQQPRPRPTEPAAKSQTVCTMDYKPVCGLDKDGKQRTFSNECLAKAAGITAIYPGPCVADITNH
jgi:hypothetical protein